MRKQSGITVPSALIIAILGILFIKAVISLVPVYWDDRMITTVLGQLKDSPEFKKNSVNDMYREVERLLSRNNLKVSTENLEIILLDSNSVTIEWEYERRIGWVGNIDFVVTFKHQEELQ